ncbi:hypothetical protein K438DRAFT_1984242 [Mycena galopus ATCC 62051]|nr:hypothetical protein K438DRAFT_1984242 [Mycena galopus ATCC 62051]
MPGNDSLSITPGHTPCPRSPNASNGNTIRTASPPLPHTPSASPSASPGAGGIPLPSALPSLLHLHDGHDDKHSALGPDDDEEPWEGIPKHENLPAGPDDDEEPWGGILEHDDPDDSEEPWGGISDDTADPPSQKGKTMVPYLADCNESELPDVDGLTTWASRNPGKSVLLPRPRPRRVLGPEQRRTQSDKRKNTKSRTAALNAEIAQLNKERNAKIAELATKHKFKVPLVKQRLTATSAYKKPRKPSLFRAQEHYLAKVLNKGRPHKERLTLHQIRRRVPTWHEFQNMSKTFKDQLFSDLEAHRERKATSAHASNKAASADATHTLKRIFEEAENLQERTGMYCVAFFTKGHVHDTAVPFIMETGGALNFFRESLKLDPIDVQVRFEQWCCARAKGFLGNESFAAMRKAITLMIKNGLIFASKRAKCAMNYERYIQVIVLGYGCIIVGWPKSVDFTSPTNISSSADMRTLYEAWKDGTCKWKEKIESGEVVEKVRQGRSDKGEARGANVRTMGKRAAAVKSKGKSKSMVEDSDEEEDEGKGKGKGKDEGKDEDEDEKDSDEELVPKKKNKRGSKSVGSSKSKQTSEEEDSDGEHVPKKKARSAQSRASSKPKQTGEEEESDGERVPKKRARDAKSGASLKPRQKRKLRDEEEEEDGPTLSKKVKRSGGEKRKRVEEEDDGEVESNPPVKKKKKNNEPPKRKTAAAKVKPTARKPKEKAPPVADKPRPKPRAAFRGAPPPPARGSRDDTQHTDDEVGMDSEECHRRASALKRNREAATDSVVAQDIADRKAAEAKAASERAGDLALQADVSTEAQEAANQKAADAQASAEMAAKKVAALAAKVAAEVHGLHDSPPPSTSVPTSKRNTVKGKAGGPPGARF